MSKKEASDYDERRKRIGEIGAIARKVQAREVTISKSKRPRQPNHLATRMIVGSCGICFLEMALDGVSPSSEIWL